MNPPFRSRASTVTCPWRRMISTLVSKFAFELLRIVQRTTCAQNFEKPGQPTHCAAQWFFASEVKATALPRP